jgi:hypothetical protein
MKAIKTDAIITGVRSKVDRSLGVTLSTPELTTEERAEFMNLQGVNLHVLFEPADSVPAEVYEVKKEVNQKTQGQRIRGVLFCLWKQEGELGDFEEYYRNKTEQYIEFLKQKLEG